VSTPTGLAPLPDADAVASALGSTWALLATTLKTGWAREAAGVHTLVTGVPVPALNGAWVVRNDGDAAEVRAGLADVARDGVPFCLETRPSWREGEVIAAAHGMVADADIPLMAAVGPINASPVDGLSLRDLAADEAPLHCEVAGPAFGAPPDLFAAVITEDVLARGEVRGYVGEVDGEAVVTAMSVTVGDAVGIFNVATLADHRRRGYGAAITARAARDGFLNGASWAWLQSSAVGYGVYERLGFTTLERWPCWVSRV